MAIARGTIGSTLGNHWKAALPRIPAPVSRESFRAMASRFFWLSFWKVTVSELCSSFFSCTLSCFMISVHVRPAAGDLLLVGVFARIALAFGVNLHQD